MCDDDALSVEKVPVSAEQYMGDTVHISPESESPGPMPVVAVDVR